MRRWMFLVGALALRGWRRHPLRQALSALSVALGVALYVSTELTTGTIDAAVEKVSDAFEGGVDLIATRDAAGIPERDVDALRKRPEFSGVSGAVQSEVRTTFSPPLTLIGIDPIEDRKVRAVTGRVDLDGAALVRFLTDEHSVLMTRRFLELTGKRAGDRFEVNSALGRVELVIAGSIDVPEEFAGAAVNYGFLTLGNAQRLFARDGRVDRVDLRIAAGATPADAERAAREVLPVGTGVMRPRELLRQQTAAMDTLRGTFALSGLLALLIAVFFVFNTVSAAIAERTRDAGMWRSIGMTRTQLVFLIAAEACVLGFLGLVLGLALGRLLANASLDLTADVVNAVHFRVPPLDEPRIPAALVAEAVLLAFGATLSASLLAIIPLARKRPLEILQPGLFTATRRRAILRLGIAGVALLCLAGLLAWSEPPFLNGILGRVLALLIPVSIALAAPAVVLFAAAPLRRIAFAHARPPAWLALDALREQPARTALTVTAFALSLGLVIGHGAYTRAMHETLRSWLERSIPADVIVSGDVQNPGAVFPFKEEAVKDALRLPGVEGVFRLRFRTARIDEKTALIVALDFAKTQGRTKYRFMEGDEDDAYRRVPAGEAVMIAENLAWRTGLGVGATLDLPIPGGVKTLPIAGVVRDYHNPGGAVFIDLSLYRELYGDDRVDFAELLLKPGTDRRAIADATRDVLPAGYDFLGVTAREDYIPRLLFFVDDLKNLSLVQLVLSLAIGSLGIVVTVLLSVLNRARELALLEAIGMDRRARRRSILFEVLVLAAASTLVGMLIGNMFFIPANFVFREYSGFVFEHVWPVEEMVQGAGLAILTAAAAAAIALKVLSLREGIAALAED